VSGDIERIAMRGAHFALASARTAKSAQALLSVATTTERRVPV
jgi:hypothetical protein